MTHASPTRLNSTPGNFDRLNLFYSPRCTPSGSPIIEAYHGTIPDRLVPFRYRHPTKNDAIHFFLDDFRFECVWNRPTHYAQWYRDQTVLSPDFSINYNYNINIQRWNHYRSMWLGAYMQSQNVIVIPTVCWSTQETFDFCFDGIQEGGVVAIGSHGIHQVENIIGFSEGVNELIKRIRPSTILCAGKFNNKYIGSLGKIEVIEYSNDFKSHTYIK
jgi:hypothetical protein